MFVLSASFVFIEKNNVFLRKWQPCKFFVVPFCHFGVYLCGQRVPNPPLIVL